MLTTIVSLALAGTAQIAEAPDRLITPQGVELSNDGRVFVLFAALNALGFSDESERKRPPLRAPVYHPVRETVREALRKIDPSKLAELKKFIEANPATIEAYLGAVLAHDLGLDKAVEDLPGSAKSLAGVVPHVKRLGAEPALVKVFDDVALEQRKHALELVGRLDKTFGVAAKHVGTSVRGPARLIVVSNPLDSHGAVRTVELGKTTYLVVGPGLDTAARATLQASLRPIVRGWVGKGFGGAAKLKKHWEGIRGYKSVTQRWPDAESYAAETLSRILAFRASTEAQGQKVSALEDEFLERETKNGLRWARPIAQALDGRGNESMESTVAKVLARATP